HRERPHGRQGSREAGAAVRLCENAKQESPSLRRAPCAPTGAEARPACLPSIERDATQLGDAFIDEAAHLPSLPGVKIAVIEGPLDKAVPIMFRLKFPPNYKVGPHWHPGSSTSPRCRHRAPLSNARVKGVAFPES